MNNSNTKRTKCEVVTRVMGYFRPVSHYNSGKKSEFYSRQYFCHNSSNQQFNDTYSSVDAGAKIGTCVSTCQEVTA